MKKELNTKNSKYFGAFLIFVVLCLLIGAFCFQYYNKLQDAIREESSGYLQEVSQRIGSNIDRTIKDSYAVLSTMATVLKNAKADSFDEVKPVVEVQREYWDYKDIMLIDENGVAYNDSGDTVALNGGAELLDTLINKEYSMSTSQMVNNKEYIIFAIPIENMIIGGKPMVALASTYSPETFSEFLSMSAFNGEAYSQIIGIDGSIVVRSSAQAAKSLGYNVLSTIEISPKDGSKTKLKNDLSESLVGLVECSIDGEQNYMIYTPLSPEDWFLATFVPVDTVNERSNMILNITLLICGLITLLFAGLIAFLTFTFTRNRSKLEQIAFVDPVTKGNTAQKFYLLAEEALKESNRPEYALVYTNFQKFKVLNEQFGRHTCDGILSAFNEIIEDMLTGKECMGRLSADNFCILFTFKDERDMLDRFNRFYENAVKYIGDHDPIWQLPMVQFGVYIINNDSMEFPVMIDRAKLALRELPKYLNSKLCYAIYDDEVRRRLFREKHLEDIMEEALKAREFKVYLQPKYRLSDERIGGAEALSRWVSEEEGMIFPDEFIPLFEKNGFIKQLDLWVFEEVCRRIRAWLDAGIEPVKISVNCSRIHLKEEGFLRAYKEIAKNYNVPPGFIEIELTESIVMEDTKRLLEVIDEIHKAGFECSMDDFGSGYSSLNMIQEISVDTLKLDRIFFNGSSDNSWRMKSVITGVVNMSKALKMTTVAEGVECREHVEILKSIGCDYIQGYVFARPMPVEEFEKLAFEEFQKEDV